MTTISISSSVKNIGSYAFYCENLTDVKCRAKEVPATEYNVFHPYIKYAKLYVPKASMSAYRSTSPWNSFGLILALEDLPEESGVKGDMDGDGRLSVADLAVIANIILNGNAPTDSDLKGDMDGDGKLSVADLAVIATKILGGE